MNPIIDKLHAEKDTWRTFLMVLGSMLGVALLLGGIIFTVIGLFKGLF